MTETIEDTRRGPHPETSPERFDEDAWQALLVEAAEGVRTREDEHELPRDLLGRLLALGLGRARIPRRDGGLGWSLHTTFEHLIDLAAADPHLAHVFRGHLVLLEEIALFAEPAVRETWFARAAAGDFIGNAQSELTATLDIHTTLTRREGLLLLNGTKYYTTGSIYADWIDLVAVDGEETVLAAVSTDQSGVSSADDWNGFGQQLTGSGTTHFVDAHVDPSDVRRIDRGAAPGQLRQGLFQLVLLSVLAGIAEAAVRSTVTYVSGRRRMFGRLGETEVREDPIVQEIVGRASSGAFATRALVLSLAARWDRIIEDHQDARASDEDFAAGKRDVFRIQGEVIDRVLTLCTDVFEVGGASAVARDRGLDRFWRHARTIASHNPVAQRRRLLGAVALGVADDVRQIAD